MEEQQKTKKECLAKKLAKKKDENLRQIAEHLLSNICTLAELRYKDSFFSFRLQRAIFSSRKTLLGWNILKFCKKS